ncbi:DNA translocase FtsK [Granulicella sibirica]|uniref:Cell division protein FtsK n=1 Tax=Granulicella sibirica TaxID=2479048 RepID=A0A4Q0SW46_9BACT|nr:DNA translocase FtsK [Granulicella sibirica]RXH55335.1 Cell division protein FtsK [Granulicella sibirica]
MKPLRLDSTPTRNRRLNEILGMIVLVSAGLLLLALISYTPSDPSFNTAGGYATGRPARNWTGMVGAFASDALLQTIGIAVFFLPLVMIRLGICWLRSKPAGSPAAKNLGLVLWLIAAPAAIALLPSHLLWRSALPIEGAFGRIVSDAMIHFLNLPGATIVLALMVAVSLYLATTFTFSTAREWATTRFGFLATMRERLEARRQRRASREALDDAASGFESKRELAARKLRRENERDYPAPVAVTPEGLPIVPEPTTLLGGLFGWLTSRRKHKNDLGVAPPSADPEPAFERISPSLFSNQPRTNVDAPPVTPLSTAAAAAAPYADALAAASRPIEPAAFPDTFHEGGRDVFATPISRRTHEDDEDDFFANARPLPIPNVNEIPSQSRPRPTLVPKAAPAAARTETPQPIPPPLPQAPEPISFGRRADADVKAVAITPKSIRGYKLPPSSLLFHSEEQSQVREEALREEARTLVEKCAEFGVDGTVTQINPGPVVTTFEFRPDAGVKYSRVTGLADDLCLAMAAESILIERMAGKSTVGIQVPNHDRETIWLRDVVECESFVKSKSKLAIALGKDINGAIVTADLAAMPHVLIAGSTGSGKSVAINAMIMSVLYKSTPEQVRMILVDPKRVELGMYEGIPHLFTPIITEAKLAANALRNAVREMERRLKLLAANHVRNIDQFNKLFDNGSEYLFEDVNQEPLPYIMIIIDELADLMMLDRSNVEESITRLAQMARAVGIHLVLATQRPSVDVITGLIKANVPTRMSFRLATKTDSRTIIDSNGAESLLGRGDMLFLPPGTSRLQRVHAPFVTEKEIAAVTEFWRAQGEAEYVEGFLEGPKDEKDGAEGSDPSADDNDPMYDDAVRLVFEFQKASTSLLQRRLRIGYGRAAHLIDLMHRDGLVGPPDGSKPREILKTANWISEVEPISR